MAHFSKIISYEEAQWKAQATLNNNFVTSYEKKIIEKNK